MVGLVAQPEPPLGEHGGGVRRATSSSRCCYPGASRPLPPPRQPPCADGSSVSPLCPASPIAGEQQPLCPGSSQSKATQTLGATPPLGAAQSGPARPPDLRVTGSQCAAGGRCSTDQSGSARTAEATPSRAPQPIAGDVNRRRRAPGGRWQRAGTRCSPWRSRARPRRCRRGGGRDERSLEALSLAGGGGAAVAGRQLSEGRRATLASALELEGTVLREGRLTQFVANNLERRIRLSGAPRGEPPAGGGGSSIPAIDPGALQDVVTLAGQVAAQVDELLRNVHCGLQALTALSVGCIQTYRDGVESLGEAADLSIRAMYALVARCEELDRAMQPVPALAKRIRDMKGTLERLEGLCK
ncbi:LOW QUALITY PROTEIN: BLOC-1-related complex subunit 6 [Geothlypis trichas]